jgi:hypothetical protein
MLTIIAAGVYGAFIVGYVGMLLLTEHSAARYTSGEIHAPQPRAVVVLRAADGFAPSVAARSARRHRPSHPLAT